MAQPEVKKSEGPVEEGSRAPEMLPPEVDWSTEPAPLHANFVTVASSEEEFSIMFGAVSTQMKKTPDGRNYGRFISSIRVSPGTFYKALVVMISVWNRWTERDSGQKQLPRFVQVPVKDAENK